MISFTHDCEMPALLPGVKPTGRKVAIPFVVVVGFKDGKIEFERIYWDQASMLVQIGLLDKSKLPVTGRRAGRAPARSEPAVQHADPEGLTRSARLGAPAARRIASWAGLRLRPDALRAS